MDAADFARDCMGFHPDAVQERLLRTTERRVVVSAARMGGKSTLARVKALHAAWQRPEGTVVVVCATPREGARMKASLGKAAARLGIAGRITVVAGAAAKFGRVDVAVIDDAASVKDEVYDALRPAVAAARGEMWLLSTPGKKEGFFYEAWKGRSRAKLKVPANECPHITADFLAEEKEELGPKRFGSEYECEFEGDVEVTYVAEWVDDKGVVHGRFGPDYDWLLSRDGPWTGPEMPDYDVERGEFENGIGIFLKRRTEFRMAQGADALGNGAYKSVRSQGGILRLA